MASKIALPSKRQAFQSGIVVLGALVVYEFVISPWLAKITTPQTTTTSQN